MSVRCGGLQPAAAAVSVLQAAPRPALQREPVVLQAAGVPYL